MRSRADPALLTGRGRFVDDVKVAGTLEACFVRSPYAHAKIRAIDTTAARVLPGVHAVLLADDLPGAMATQPIPMILPVLGIKAFRTQLCLARDEVSYAGQSVALVVADTLPVQIELLKAGLSKGQVGQRPAEMGYKTMFFLKDIKDGKPAPKDPTYTGLDVCTPETATTCIGK